MGDFIFKLFARQDTSTEMTSADFARNGGAVVPQVVEAMGEISNNSKRIADITRVIDSIAFQTNILALNTAVEATRAKEQERGFAEVAIEVRDLAYRSAAAAKKIKALIGNSHEKTY